MNRSFFPIDKAYDFLSSRKIYTDIGITLKPDLQNTGIGFSKHVYDYLRGGIFYGWTSNPIIVHRRRKFTQNLLFFPLLGEPVDTLEKYAVTLFLFSDIMVYEEKDYLNYEFGTMHSVYFVEERGDKYKKITDNMFKSGKLSILDAKRLKYILSYKKFAGAILSW